MKGSTKGITLLVKDEKNNTLVAGLIIGLGRVSYNLLQDTYRWISTGEKEAHSQYWQYLLKNTARMDEEILEWSEKKMDEEVTKNIFSTIDAKKNLCFSLNLAGLDDFQFKIYSLSNNESVKITLNKDQVLTNHYCTNYWPNTPGWHQLKVTNNQKSVHSLYFYVNTKNEWMANRQKEKIESTLNLQQKIEKNSVSSETLYAKPNQLVNDWVYWLLIVISLSFIWIENKFFG